MADFNENDFLENVKEIKNQSKSINDFDAFNIFNIIPRRFKREEFSQLFEIYNDYGLDKQRDSKSKPKGTWYYKFWNPKKI